MAISERLQQRIKNLMGMVMPQPSAPQMPMQKMQRPTMMRNPRMTMEIRDRNRNRIDDREEGMFKPGDFVPIPEAGSAQDGPDDSFSGMIMTPEGPMKVGAGAITEREMEVLQNASNMGRKGDTQLGHLEVGDVVVPPSVIANNPLLDEMLESTMLNQGIDPQQRIVGLGLASLNPNTGLEEFGIFDSITKGLEKFAEKTGLKKLGKKLAPLAPIAAQFIPGGPIVSGAVGAGLQGLLGGQKPKDYLADAALGAGIGALAQGATRGFTKEGMSIFDPNFVGPLDPSKLGGGAPLRQSVGMDIIKGLQSGGIKGALGNLVDEGTIAGGLLGIGGGGAGQAIVNEAGEVIGYTGGGGGGGLGGALGLAGIGALSAGLAKLAYEDAKKQKGVPLTPLTTMSPTGRYNIEAEIARRQGLPAPNPVEFGLLPAGTLPKLSGGQPRGKSLGGAIEELEGGMARGMSRGGIMAFAAGGAVAMQEGGEMDPSKFPPMDGDINGAGTETSDDIPAMLSDGEFVMTARAVRGAGTYDMNQDNKGIITLTPSMEENRERGMDLMYKVMDAFSGQARPS
jgi:hypothetical protein